MCFILKKKKKRNESFFFLVGRWNLYHLLVSLGTSSFFSPFNYLFCSWFVLKSANNIPYKLTELLSCLRSRVSFSLLPKTKLFINFLKEKKLNFLGNLFHREFVAFYLLQNLFENLLVWKTKEKLSYVFLLLGLISLQWKGLEVNSRKGTLDFV